jgi:PST family polysaccharide transporter
VDAATTLRWQVLGDLLRVASWPMGFILIALSHGRIYLAVEMAATILLMMLAWIGIPLVGIEGTGLAYLGMYGLYLPLIYMIARNKIGFAWSRRVVGTVLSIATASAAVFAMSVASGAAGLALGFTLGAVAAVIALQRLKEALPERLRTLGRSTGEV